MARTADKNELVVSIDLYPNGLLLYGSADWSQVFVGFSHSMSLSWVEFDSSTNRLRAAFTYNENLQG